MCRDQSQNTLSAFEVEYLSSLNDLNSWRKISSLGVGKKSLAMIPLRKSKRRVFSFQIMLSLLVKLLNFSCLGLQTLSLGPTIRSVFGALGVA